MKKMIGAIALAAMLAGCDPTPEETARIRQQLPPGCEIRDLGSYGEVSHVVIVWCDGRRTETQSYKQRVGRTSRSHAVVQIANR